MVPVPGCTAIPSGINSLSLTISVSGSVVMSETGDLQPCTSKKITVETQATQNDIDLVQ
jgi:hypothetical protein